MGRKKHTHWRTEATKILLNTDQDGFKLNIQHLAKHNNIENTNLFRRAIKELFDNNILIMETKIRFNNPKHEQEYFMSLEKLYNETKRDESMKSK